MSVKIALAGNPNCGKTTLFNALTGSQQFVGNWPGVTVEKKEGKLKSNKDIIITDLPGIYSLSPYTLEEVVARNYILMEHPDAIINIIDGTNIERNLYLSTQIMELGIPVIFAINMMDVVEKNGDRIDIDKLSDTFGCEVVEISAIKEKGIEELVEKATKLVHNKEVTEVKHEFCEEVEAVIDSVISKLGDSVKEEQKRFFAIKLLERDEKIANMIENSPDVSDETESLEAKFEDDIESIITNERYSYITNVLGNFYTKKIRRNTISDKIDKVVTNRFAALPIFAAIMFLVYFISVTTVGTWVTDWTNDGLFGDGFHLFGIGTSEFNDEMNEYAADNLFTDELVTIVDDAVANDVTGAQDIKDAIEEGDFATFDEMYGLYADNLSDKGFDISGIYDGALGENAVGVPDTSEYGVWVPGVPVLVEKGLDAIGCAKLLKSLILDGIVAGVGAVLGFVPQMLVLFMFLAFLEACGYMARVAFIMDKIFYKFGLSGKSFIPMLIGVGCGVPGIMASRTIENDRDRKMTIITTTFIPCGAKLPIIALIATALFDGAWWLAPVAYFIGSAAVIVSGVVLKKTKLFAGDTAPFVMELPAYHMPRPVNVLRSMWERGWSFIKKAGTVILLSSIIIWAGSCFGMVDGKFTFNLDMDMNNSVLGILGNAVKIIFAPLGFDSAQAVIATIMGLIAKEEVVAVFGILDFAGMSALAAFSFMVFNLLCAPCFAAMGAIKREMNSTKWFLFAIGYQTLFAYVISLIIYQIGGLVTGELAFGVFSVVAIVLILFILYMIFRPNKYKAGRK